MPSTRKQINIRPHPDDYELISRIAAQWNVTRTEAVERLALMAAHQISSTLDSANASVLQQFSNSASPLLNLV